MLENHETEHHRLNVIVIIQTFVEQQYNTATNNKCPRNMKKQVDYEQSLSFLGPSSKTPEKRKWQRAWLKARDGRGTTKYFLLTLPPSFLASRGFAAQRWRARALPSLNLKKKRGSSQSKKQVARGTYNANIYFINANAGEVQINGGFYTHRQ